MLKVVEKRDEREVGEEVLLLDEIARRGAVRMLIQALKAEADALNCFVSNESSFQKSERKSAFSVQLKPCTNFAIHLRPR